MDSMEHVIHTPLTKETVMSLAAGDSVKINGTIYTARDAAHKRMIELLEKGEELPFDVCNQIIYYVGPCPARAGSVIGPAGPTTSSRMDAYAPKLIDIGLTGMIGKGLRSSEVVNAMIKNHAVYFGAVGGLGALLAKSIIKAEVIAFPELGTEAVRRLEIRDFPAIVAIDCLGKNYYEIGRQLNRAD
jgi:fumarate hydratase subunit beta